MTIFRHEMKCGFKSLMIWSVSVAFLIFVCMIMYPQMNSQMEGINEMFADMGEFSAAFGMDKINFSDVMGFYGIECGNMLGMGGAIFAALLGVSSLSKEEGLHTADFLFSHPVSRRKIIVEKLLFIFTALLIFNLITVAVSVVSFSIIGESIAWNGFILFHLAQFIAQLEIAAITFAISAFLKHGGYGVGIATALIAYFINLIANISEKADFLHYISPFSYAEAADIIREESLDALCVGIGLVLSTAAIVLAFLKYTKKDLAS